MSRLSKYLRPRDEIMQTMGRIYLYRVTTTPGEVSDDLGRAFASLLA